MLADKDRIFTNLYGFQSAGLKAAQARGDAAGSAGDDDLAVLPTAERRRVHAELRARDPAGARATLAALLPRLGADARLTLVEQLALHLSDDDLPLLRELAGDR